MCLPDQRTNKLEKKSKVVLEDESSKALESILTFVMVFKALV